MLRLLRNFFEIVVYTSKSKEEANVIISAIEKGEVFFHFIIPVNYCKMIKEENIYSKDLNIFLGNRELSEICIIGTQPFDFLHF
jgi:TFIIF-interacting CTD phosphatase-like protein